jgi:hypothetical protein
MFCANRTGHEVKTRRTTERNWNLKKGLDETCRFFGVAVALDSGKIRIDARQVHFDSRFWLKQPPIGAIKWVIGNYWLRSHGALPGYQAKSHQHSIAHRRNGALETD